MLAPLPHRQRHAMPDLAHPPVPEAGYPLPDRLDLRNAPAYAVGPRSIGSSGDLVRLGDVGPGICRALARVLIRPIDFLPGLLTTAVRQDVALQIRLARPGPRRTDKPFTRSTLPCRPLRLPIQIEFLLLSNDLGCCRGCWSCTSWWRVERAEFVGVADRHAAHHAVVVEGVLTEPPERGRVSVQGDGLFSLAG
jgi:hypothetical protein